jgi:tricorn protease
MSPGYHRFPTLHSDRLVFVSEDDLWAVPAAGGVARRLTANLGAVSAPFFSPNGATLAFTGREEGHPEVYVMDSEGGPARRLTYLGAATTVIGWTPGGDRILFASDAGQPIDRVPAVFALRPEGGLPEPWPVGHGVSITFGPGGRSAIGRNNNDPARWKRYRGGTAGDIWVDPEGNGRFQRLVRIAGNLARPMWIGGRIYFLSDHEGYGNIYSCLPNGADVRRHTDRTDYYVRFPNSDGRRIAYHAGGDLYVLDPAAGVETPVAVEYRSPRVHRQRRFVDPARHLELATLHPEGHSLAITARGRSFAMGNWEGAVMPVGREGAVRYRLAQWLNDGQRLVAVADVGGEEALEVHSTVPGPGTDSGPVRLGALDIGRVSALKVSPTADALLLANHRNELLHVDLADTSLHVVDRSEYHPIGGFDWSPDGNWAAYGFATSNYQMGIRLWDRRTGAHHDATTPVLTDRSPAFDPEGKFLYFLGVRDLNPVYDALHFELSFPQGTRPFLVTLQRDTLSPFMPVPHALKEGGKPDKPSGEEKPGGANEGEGEEAAKEKAPAAGPPEVRIDLEGIVGRVAGFPVPAGIYGRIAGLKGKAIFTSFPVEGALGRGFGPSEPEPKGVLEVFDFETQRHEPLISGLTGFQVARDGKSMLYRAGNRLRVVRAGAKPDENASSERPGRRSGWIDLGRVKVSVEPGVEWRQMAREAWRLQRENFWTPNMSAVDWDAVWERYAPLIDRVGTRGELSDLMWEMQGELGTSHAYEMGGDYRPEPAYPQGFLGADYAYDAEADCYEFTRIVRGTAGEPDADSPLNAPGVNVRPGDRLLALNGRRVTAARLPQELLVHQAGAEVALTVQRGEEAPRVVTVRARRSEALARYREWVEANRCKVVAATGGRVGYVHIPDMGARGFAEFHRLYLTEVARDGLVVDVRYNRGGHVSQLLIEKLARKRVGYDVSRWGKPDPYPSYSVAGPMVALTNQWAGSDGDIFCHVFKLMKLGPLIGTRTWGGVIGISPRHALADGSVTTQPEFSFWFVDVGWGVENYGTDPDIEVDVAPQDYAAGRDPQLDRAIAEVLRLLEENPPAVPAFDERPVLTPPPKLP